MKEFRGKWIETAMFVTFVEIFYDEESAPHTTSFIFPYHYLFGDNKSVAPVSPL